MDITPNVDVNGLRNLSPPSPDNSAVDSLPVTASRNLGVVVEGRFESFFAGGDSPHHVPKSAGHEHPLPVASARGLLKRSPESARIVLYASNDFMDDQILNSIVAASGTQYLGPLALFMNTLDWALQDEQLLEIRSRGHFNRTLPPMERRGQLIIEYFNYGLALLWLLALALISWVKIILQRRHYARGLSL